MNSPDVVVIDRTRLNGHELFRSLIKDGCVWQGDVLSQKWSECLYFDEGNRDQVLTTLMHYREGVDFRVVGFGVWIA